MSVLRVAVIGAGLFGCLAALDLARHADQVDLFEASPEILTKASMINQARLHTGLHYPRDIATARSSLEMFPLFANRFPTAIKEINQFYAIASTGSKIDAHAFLTFIEDLGLPFSTVDPAIFFKPNQVDLLVQVPEATFDTQIIRQQLKTEIHESSRLSLFVNTSIESVSEVLDSVSIVDQVGIGRSYDRVLITTYASSRHLLHQVGIELSGVNYQVCQVILGSFPALRDTGITVMDGNFWSVMPFGFSGLHSLTSVRHTPRLTQIDDLLECQRLHPKCGRGVIFDCNACDLLPSDALYEIHEEMQSFLSEGLEFRPSRSIFTVKAVQIDSARDSRPTIHLQSPGGKIICVFSGKVGDAIVPPKFF